MKRTVGFPIGTKENEKRRVLTPVVLDRIASRDLLYFEEGYGKIMGFEDKDYLEAGAHIASREEVLDKDIICEPKIGDAEYLKQLKNKTIFGWVHAAQNPEIIEIIEENLLTVYAWEDMFKNDRHIFWRNNELAGEAAILNAIQCYGKLPFALRVAVLGRGNVAKGAMKILNQLGAVCTVYSYKKEKLFRNEMNQFDIIVNAQLWDVERKDHLIYKSDLKRLKKDALIIDVSCDEAGAIETTHPTTIENPVYTVNGVVHYAVDHTPSILYKSATKSIEKATYQYFDRLCNGRETLALKNAKEFIKGKRQETPYFTEPDSELVV